jgi:HD-GYP domain-containing protein (c-di-GMP phosphodiesterase class II)
MTLANTVSPSLLQNRLTYQVIPISIRELLFLSTAPCDIYGIKDGIFYRALRRGVFTNKNLLRELIAKGQIYLFVHREDRSLIIETVQKNLLQVTRSLSLGNPLEKGRAQMNLLTINMGYLYQNPTDDTILKLQHQCAKNLAYFLLNKIDLLVPLQREYIKQKHHFVLAQSLIASVFLIGLMKYSQLYSDQEIENLFITSYFKDIGMSSIPTEKYDQEELSDKEKEILSAHATNSVQILKGRLPLSPNHLSIIEHHHTFSLLTNKLQLNLREKQKEGEIIAGFETMLVTVMDVISAMITGRPFRKPTKIFEALDLIKILIADQYPQEFRLIVSYFKNFFIDR